jgi:hypothetical protein
MWPEEIVVEPISSHDCYYSDGAAANCDFKILFMKNVNGIHSTFNRVFIEKNGSWFTVEYLI